ncbi:MAG: adenylyltransferase/cytidyltransferase family protein [Victivallaceae bacterium]|nr:adenylyltransferase/cytidyltransferase family protein [Victivallaceae bacterium]
MIDPAEKILTLSEAVRRRAGKTLVVTNGCFDLLHRGHAEYLKSARERGDALCVLLNSDESVRELKGPSRPINCAQDRAYLLASLAAVDMVVIFQGKRCDAELAELAPEIYVKGGDYTVESLDALERAALEKARSRIVFQPFVAGHSTSSMISRMGDAK